MMQQPRIVVERAKGGDVYWVSLRANESKTPLFELQTLEAAVLCVATFARIEELEEELRAAKYEAERWRRRKGGEV